VGSSFSVTSHVIESIPIIFLEGDMTSESNNDVMKTFLSLKEKHHPHNLIINFEKINYINSAGMATIINIIQDLKEIQGEVKFVGLSEHIRGVMEIVGISDFVEIFNSNSEALSEIMKR